MRLGLVASIVSGALVGCGTTSLNTAGSGATGTASSNGGTTTSGVLTTSSGSSGAAGTTAVSGATSGTTGLSSGDTSGTDSGSTSGTTGSSTSSDGGCGQNLTWLGEVCAALTCENQPLGQPCPLSDGGIGGCYGGTCLNTTDDGNPALCDFVELFTCGACTAQSGCPTGSTCVGNDFCVLDTCAAGDDDDRACVIDAGFAFGNCCAGSCTNLQFNTDPANCGGCGASCAAGQTCESGACVNAAVCGPSNNGGPCALPSGAGGMCCLGTCVDPTSNSSNCNGCNRRCTSAETCQQGECGNGTTFGCSGGGCPTGYLCDPGAFDNICVATSCAAGADRTPCLMGMDDGTCCGGSCVALSTDAHNCGGCGIDCGSAPCVNGTCGQCPACPAAAVCLDSSGFSDCFQTMPSALCNASCGSDAVCAGTVCVAADACNVPGNTTCAAQNGTVGLCCESDCAHPLDDPENCGQCGNACDPGQQCANGVCG